MAEIPPILLTKNTANQKSYLLKVLLLLLVILITVFIVCEILGWPFLKAPTERFLTKHLERNVTIDMPFKLKLFGGIQLDVGGLEISAPNSFSVPHFVKSKNISLCLRYIDLYKLKHTDLLRIKSLRVDQIDAQLIRQDHGKSTWQFNHDETKPDSPFPTIETLIVKNGTATVIDSQHQVNLHALFHTAEGTSSSSTSSVIEVQGKLLEKPIQAKLSTAGFLPVATQASDSPAIPSKGWVEYAGLRADFDGTVSDLFGKHDVKGKLLVKGPSLSLLGNLVNIVLPTTDAFSLNGFVEKNDAIWLAKIESARVGQSNVYGEFEYNPIPEKPLLTGKLSGKNLYLADLAPSFGTKNTDGSDASPESGHVIPDRSLDFPSLNKMNAKIAVNLDHIDLGNAFSRPIAPLKANLLLQDGTLTLTDIYARTADGTVSGILSIDTHASTNHEAKTPPPTWNINLNWKDIDLDKWLRISLDRKKVAKQAGEKETPPSYITGSLNGKTKLIGSGNSTAEMLSTIDGEVSIYIHKGTVSHLIVEALGLDIAQGLGILLTKDEPLPMQCAVMDISAKNGIATPKVALIDTPVTLVLIDGKVDLAKENLDLRLAAKPKNISPFTVRSPIHVKGSFKNPAVSIEKTPILARVLGSVALAFVNPLAAIVPFIDIGSGEKSPCNESLIAFQRKP